MRAYKGLLVAALLLVPALAAAQTAQPQMQKMADGFRKLAAQRQFDSESCGEAILKSQTEACRIFYREYAENYLLLASAYEAWDKASMANDRLASWVVRRQEAAILLKLREMTKESWTRAYFGVPEWSGKIHGRPSVFMDYFIRERQSALKFRDDFCAKLESPQNGACRSDWDAYAVALGDTVLVSERLNKAVADNNKNMYFDALIEEARRRVALVELESNIKHKYMGQ